MRQPSIRQRLELSSFAEIFAGIFVGLVLYLLELKDLAHVSFLLGPALSGTRRLLERKIEADLGEVRDLARTFDLQQAAATKEQFGQGITAYLSITEDEFRQVKERIVRDAVQSLRKLATSKTTNQLTIGEYYNWLLPMILAAKPNSRIWAISTMMDSEWNDSPYEARFLEATVDSLKNGVTLERIFVVPRAIAPSMFGNRYIQAHLQDLEHLHPWLVYKEDVEQDDPGLIKEIKDGLIAFDDRVVLVDLEIGGGSRGYVTMNPQEIGQLHHLFDCLRQHGIDLRQEYDRLSAVSDGTSSETGNG